MIQELDTKWTEFIEGAGILSLQFRGETYGTFIVDEIFYKPAKVSIFTSLSINAWQSIVYDEEFKIRVALKIKDTIYDNGTYIKLNLTIYDKETNQQELFLNKYKIKRIHLTKMQNLLLIPLNLSQDFIMLKSKFITNMLIDMKQINNALLKKVV